MCHVIIIVMSEVKRFKEEELLESNKDRVDGAMELYRCVIEGEKFRGKFYFYYYCSTFFFLYLFIEKRLNFIF